MSVKYQDYYKTLGVSRSATQEEIHRAYRKLARQYHPDVNKEAGAEKQFKQVSEAYEVLKDPEKRKRYDELGADWKSGQEFRPPPGWGDVKFDFGGVGGGGAKRGRTGGFKMEGGNFSDFFDILFGRRGAGPGSGSPGSGGPGGGAGGFGGFEGFDEFARRAGGPQARGGSRQAGPHKGRSHEAELTISLEEAYHGGSREITLQGVGPDGQPSAQPRKFNVKIPPGVTDGSTIRLAGQGDPSPTGGKAGDLLLRIKLAKHPRYTVDGHDLSTELRLSPWEAALGAKVDVPTLDGPVTLTIPPGAQSGQKLRLRDKGMPTGKREGDRGDLFVRLAIAVPKELSDEERDLFEKLKATSQFDPRK